MPITLRSAYRKENEVPVKFWTFPGGELKVVYRNGEVLLNDSMDEIRARINEHFAG